MFNNCSSHDLLGMKSQTVTKKILSQYDFGPANTKATTSGSIFRQAVLKVKSLMLLVKSSKTKISATYKTNPLLYQYFYLMTVFVYVNFLVFFWIGGHGNPNYTSETGLNKFICGDKELPLNIGDNIKKCRSYLNNPLSKIFYGLNMLYIFFSLKQVRAGRKLIRTTIVDFKSMANKIQFYCYLYIPLVREFTAVLEYCVQRTCINFNDFMLINDLKIDMHLAKIKALADSSYVTGKQISRTSRLGDYVLFC